MRVMKNKRGDKMGFLTLDDRSGRIEVSVFSDTFAKHQHLLVKDTLVVVEGEVSFDDYSGSIKANARRVMSLVEARSQYVKELEVGMDEADCSGNFTAGLQTLLSDHAGSTPVVIQFEKDDARGGFSWGMAGLLVLGMSWFSFCGIVMVKSGLRFFILKLFWLVFVGLSEFSLKFGRALPAPSLLSLQRVASGASCPLEEHVRTSGFVASGLAAG